MIEHVPLPTEVQKPWGEFEQYTHNTPATVKIITVRPGGVLSRQYHYRRDELWVMLDPGACVEVGDEIFAPKRGAKVFIPRETVHRLSAPGEQPVRVLEISFGFFDEEDIVRIQDVYGRELTEETEG